MTEPLGGGAPQGAPPVCPRHPDRVSYVRCQRCERPVCPPCQRVAAVGVQCVDCVKEGAKTVRSARSVFGATLQPGQKPVLTTALIIVCIVVWVAQVTGDTVTDRFAFAPVLSRDEPWRFLTAAFLHDPDNPLHLAFNMYALWLTGPFLEAAFGRARFLAVYLLAALGGSVAMLAVAWPGSCSEAFNTYSLGASGAVFGLFGALLVVNRRLGMDSAPLITVIGINAVLGFTLPNVAWEAHLGGFVVGLVAALVVSEGAARRTAALPPATVQALGLAAVGVALIVVVVVVWAHLGMLSGLPLDVFC